MGNIIERVNVAGTTYDIASTAYAVCSNGAAEGKTINIDGFSLVTGVTIHVKFVNANTNPTPQLTISGGDSAANNPIPISGITTWEAGAVLTLTYDGSNWVRDYVETVVNNITGSGAQNYLTKFSGPNTITNGPALGADATKFLNNKGEWAVPNYIADTHYTANLITGASATAKANAAGATNSVFLNLVENNDVRNSHNIVGEGSVTVASDASGKITITGNKAGTVTSITPGNGLINGTSGTSQAAITTSGTISIATGGVTNDMLQNSSVSIAGQSVSLGGSLAASTLLSALGIGNAVHYIGESSTAITDGGNQVPTITGLDNYSPKAGDIVVYDDKEFIWTAAGEWELFGDEGSYALKSNTVTNVAWDDTNKKLTKTINSSTTDIVSASTLKSAMSLNNVTNDAQIAKSVGTTQGDIIYFTSSSAPTRLGIGTSGQILTVSSDGIPSWSTVSVDWTNINNKVFSALYVNATTAGAANDTAATTNDDTYIHLYDNNTKQSTIQLKGAGGTTIASAANSKVITITSTKYKSKGSVSALTSLKVKYNDGTAHDDSVSSATATPTPLGTVTDAVLYIKSMYYGTTSVSTGVSIDNT